jgi:hypothetical protein
MLDKKTIHYIVENYPKMKISELSKITNLCAWTIIKYAHKHGLRKCGNIYIDLSKLSNTDLAYIAGLLDGEGTVTYQGYNEKSNGRKTAGGPIVQISNTHKPTINWLVSIFGYKMRFQCRNLEKHQQCYSARIFGWKNVLVFLRACYPYLRIKKKQAEVLMKLCQSRLKHLYQKYYTSDELKLVEQLHTLNRHGSNRGKKFPFILNEMREEYGLDSANSHD